MKQWVIKIITGKRYATYEIQAETEEQAMDIAEDMFDRADVSKQFGVNKEDMKISAKEGNW